MPKQGQHKHDINDPRISKGPNNPTKTTPITTGTPKKRSTYREQTYRHEDPNKPAQHHVEEWHDDTRVSPTEGLHIRARHLRGRRSGSESNADSGTRGH